MTDKKKNKFILTQEYLKQVLKYDPETGIFVWLIKPTLRIEAGAVAGSKSLNGYITIRYNYRLYYAQRLACLYMTGNFPKHHMDHINRDKTDNMWTNLRECDVSKNNANKSRQKNNTSGYKGVGWFKRDEKWRAVIQYKGKYIHIGYFDCKHEAARAYNKKALELFGEFAHLNVIEE